MQKSIDIELQHKLFSFNKNIHFTSTRDIFVQEEYLFNFKMQNYVWRNEYIYSTSTQITFSNQKYLKYIKIIITIFCCCYFCFVSSTFVIIMPVCFLADFLLC